MIASGRSVEDDIWKEAREILAHETFLRAPMQSRLFKYLVDRTIDNHIGPITQFDIATNGLGRDSTYDDTVESYVRVQISRLRKNLAAYYSLRAPTGGGCIYIKPGNYSLSIGSPSVAYPDLIASKSKQDNLKLVVPEESSEPEEQESRKLPMLNGTHAIALTAILGMIGLAAYAAAGWFNNQPVQGLDRPNVLIRVEAIGNDADVRDTNEFVDEIRAEVANRLARSVVAIPSVDDDDRNYRIEIEIFQQLRGSHSAVFSLTQPSGKILYHVERELPKDQTEAREIIAWQVSSILSPPGVLSRSIVSEIPANPRNAFECFLLLEIGRSSGGPISELLQECSRAYPKSEFTPFLKARELFWTFQSESAEHGVLSQDSQAWLQLGQLLREYPNNPYLNSLAAKVLYAIGDCDEGTRYQKKAFEAGHDFPALELGVIVEEASCDVKPAQRIEIRDRISAIIDSQQEPHALLEVWAIAALLISGQPDKVAEVPVRQFAYDRDKPAVKLIDEMRDFAAGRGPAPDRLLKAVVWNERSRQMIVGSL